MCVPRSAEESTLVRYLTESISPSEALYRILTMTLANPAHPEEVFPKAKEAISKALSADAALEKLYGKDARFSFYFPPIDRPQDVYVIRSFVIKDGKRFGGPVHSSDFHESTDLIRHRAERALPKSSSNRGEERLALALADVEFKKKEGFIDFIFEVGPSKPR